MKLRLGLDIGTNSIGWALFNLDENNDPNEIFRSGVRIFDDGRDPLSFSSLKATRREKRSARRGRDRFLVRQKQLIEELINIGLMPQDETSRKSLAFKNPYIIRKEALDNDIDPFDIGRAIFHINQRRGFKSSRKTDSNEGGVVKESIAVLEQNLMKTGSRTIGEFLANRNEKRETVRARRLGSKSSDLYELYPNRYMLEQEVDLIWKAQNHYNASIFTEVNLTKIKDIIFYQRPLKAQEVGRCTFLPDEYRIAKAQPSFQRFRIFQELHNLSWIDRSGVAHPVVNDKILIDRLAEELNSKKKITFKQMRAIISKLGIVNHHVEFNLESDIRDHLLGNQTSDIMRSKKGIGEQWDTFSNEDQDNLISLLLDHTIDDEEAKELLASKFKIPEDKIETVLDIRLPDGHGSLSKKAIDQILPIMVDNGLNYYDAVHEAGLEIANLFDNKVLAKNLDYYGKALSGHVMNASGKLEDSDEKRYGIITNPTVHIALNQIRLLINEIIRLHGKPEQVVIELARDLPMGADGKKQLKRHQEDNQKKNEDIRIELKNLGVIDNRANRQKYQLWQRLGNNPSDRSCPFTGNIITISDLFSDRVEVEHLLPFSITLDDSMANKTICYRQANRDKSNRSPHEAFGSSPDGYDFEAILERSKNLPKANQWRFLPDAMEISEKEGGFLARQLNDTRYIGRYTSQYIESIIPKNNIWVVTGRLTALLRGHWGLNSILHGHNSEADKTDKKKSRDDHRNHAVDAIVVGMTSRSLLQKISSAAKKAEAKYIQRVLDERTDPWTGFRDDVIDEINKIIVSHRPRKKIQGQLHNDTAYGLIKLNDNGPSLVVHKIPVSSFTKVEHVEKIRDNLLRSQLLDVTNGLSGKDFADKLEAWSFEKGIRSIRIVESISVIPIKDKEGNNYKAYKGDSNAYMEIYKDPISEKWKDEVVSKYDANSKNYIPNWRKNYPALNLIERLYINDCFALEEEDSERAFYRIQKLSKGSIVYAPLNESNVDKRTRNKDDPFSMKSKSPESLRNLKFCRIHISPSGLIMDKKNERKSS